MGEVRGDVGEEVERMEEKVGMWGGEIQGFMLL